MVSFNNIQPYWKLPGVSIEVDPSQAGTPVNPKYGLLVGIAKGGTAPFDTPVAVGTQTDANAFFGTGSMLARMFAKWFSLNKSQILFALPIAEPGAGVAATGTITVTAAATVAGTLALYIAGQKVTVAIGSADTTAVIATNINAAINAVTDLPVTSTVATNVVTLTAKFKGLSGNDIRVETNYRGFYGGEVLPTSLALTISGSNFLTGGTGTPTFTTGIANLGDAPYKFVVNPFSDSGTISVWDTEYGFTDSGRWGWIRQSYGQVFSARRDTYSNLITYGPTNNSAIYHIMAVENLSPSPVWEWAAQFGAQAARAFSLDPARPLQTLQLNDVLPAPYAVAGVAARFNKTQLNALASVGLAIQGTDIDGSGGSGIPIILREQSTYQKNVYGMADNAFELATTLATLDELFTRLRQAITNKYPRHKLANNGTRFGPGQAIITPNLAKAELIAQYDAWEFDGLVENVDAFVENLIVVRSSVEPNTLEVLLPPDLVNQLRRFNVRAQFRLQFPVAIS
jgi:phage tail sheath gpL-like